MSGFESLVMCVALTVFHEARSEPIEGQIAVAQVIMNRAKTRKLDICSVVYEPKQFSWTNGGLSPEDIPNGVSWSHARKVAVKVLRGDIKDLTSGATHYHADYISKPKWAYNLQHVKTYGRHLFYK